MGFLSNLFGGGNAPTMSIPAAPVYKTPNELYQEALSLAKTRYGTDLPNLLGAEAKGLRGLEAISYAPSVYKPYYEAMGLTTEPAISDILSEYMPALTGISPSFYEQYMPTSIEEILANQYFRYAQPEAEKAIRQQMSLSGLAYSPITAELIGRETGKLGVDIGQYLAGLGQTRATQALERQNILAQLGLQKSQLSLSDILNLRSLAQQQALTGLQGQYNIASGELGIGDILLPYMQTYGAYDTAQKQADYQTALQQAQSQYQIDLQKYQQKQAKTGVLSQLAGAGIGFALGGPAGASLGAGIGGTLGGGEGFDLGTSLSLMGAYPETFGFPKTTTTRLPGNIYGGTDFSKGMGFAESVYKTKYNPYIMY